MTQMEDLLEKILQLTTNDKVTWRTTVNPDAFLAVLGDHAVVIARSSTGLSNPKYRLEVRNSGGSTVDILQAGEPTPSDRTPRQFPERRRKMEVLFERARNSAVNDGLREVIERLDRLIEDMEKV